MATSDGVGATEIEVLPDDDEDSLNTELQKLFDESQSAAKPKKSNTSQNSLRMHRSTVRPFFCCGSELSLASIPDNAPVSGEIYLSDDETSDVHGCKHMPSAYANAKISRKKRHSASLKSKYSWILKFRGGKTLSKKPNNHGICQCCDVESLCDIFDDEDAAGTSDTTRVVNKTKHPRAGNNKKGARAKRPSTSIQQLPRQTRLQRHTDWDEIRIGRMNVNQGWCRGIAIHDRHIVDRLCSSFQRGCEMPDRGRNSVYQEFIDLPHAAMIGLSPGRRSSSLTAHTQVDYVHHLVPDLLEISKRSFYWGVMDRYEAERLLDNKPEGTFLLRDSAQDDFLFSVSFRRYGRSLHARIEQWKHKFSFDSHDPGVFATESVCGLIEHYKDPSCCMFFEPMLTQPLHRSFPFSLQHLCRSVVCSHATYDGVNQLPVPNKIKECLKYYHYKQKVRVRKLDSNEEIPAA